MADTPVHRAPIPGYAPATAKLIVRLARGKIGDEASDVELSEIAGGDTAPHGTKYHSLLVAQKAVARRDRLVWIRIPGEGKLRCAGAAEIVGHVESRRKHIRRQAVRSTLEADVALDHADELDPREVESLKARAAQMATVAILSSSQATKRITAANIYQPGSMRKMIEAMQ